MNNNLEIPKELGIKEGLLYKSLMRNPADNLEKRWKLSKTQDLLGRKKTDGMSGEVKVTFSKEKRLDVAFRTDSVGRKAEAVDKGKVDENIVTKEMLLKKSSDLDMDIRVAEEKKQMIEWMLKEFFGK